MTLLTCRIATKVSTPHCLSPLFSKSIHSVSIVTENCPGKRNSSLSCRVQKSPGDEGQASAGVERVGADPARGWTHPHHRVGQRATTSKG